MLLLSLLTVFSHTPPPYGSPVVSPSYAPSLLSIRLPIGHSASVLQPALPRTHLRCFYSTIPPPTPPAPPGPSGRPTHVYRLPHMSNLMKNSLLLANELPHCRTGTSSPYSSNSSLNPTTPLQPSCFTGGHASSRADGARLGIGKRPSSRHWSTA